MTRQHSPVKIGLKPEVHFYSFILACEKMRGPAFVDESYGRTASLLRAEAVDGVITRFFRGCRHFDLAEVSANKSGLANLLVLVFHIVPAQIFDTNRASLSNLIHRCQENWISMEIFTLNSLVFKRFSYLFLAITNAFLSSEFVLNTSTRPLV